MSLQKISFGGAISMYHIKTLNSISEVGLERFDPANYMICGDEYCLEGILVRSAKMHDYEFPESLLAIARAGAGVNNIPLERCSEAGIAVFNTPRRQCKRGERTGAVRTPYEFS